MLLIVNDKDVHDINDLGDDDDIECIDDFDFFQSDSVLGLAGRWYQSFSRCWSEKDLLRRQAVREGETRFQKFQSKPNFSDEESRVQTPQQHWH